MASKTKNIKPLHDYVLVDPVEEEDKSSGGIYLPETAKEKPTVGVVVAVGPGRTDKNGKLIKVSVSEGAKVYYKKWGGSEVKVGRKEMLLVEEKDILAIVK